ncbi:MAG: hypothetical protein ACYSUN_06275 [Planctomycetota bacterium]|jgi:hypothetical protein
MERRLWVGILLCTAVARAGDLPGEAALRRHGIRPEAASISAHLRSLYAIEGTQAELEELVQELGSRDHALRDLSARRLAGMGTSAVPALRRATHSSDPEARRHANRLLALALQEVDPSLLYACFRAIESRRISGLTRDILIATLYCEEEYLRVAARRALGVTCGPQDAGILRRTASARSWPWALSWARRAVPCCTGSRIRPRPTPSASVPLAPSPGRAATIASSR